MTIAGIILGILTFLLIGAPYLPELAHFKFDALESNATLTHNSLHAMLYHSTELVLQRLPIPSADTSALLNLLKGGLKGLLWVCFALFLLMKGIIYLRKKEFPTSGLLETALLAQFLLIAVVSSKFYAWYFGMFFPLALLLPEGHRLRQLVLILTGTQLFSITLLGQAHVLNYLLLMGVPMAVVLLPLAQKFNNFRQDTRLLTR